MPLFCSRADIASFRPTPTTGRGAASCQAEGTGRRTCHTAAGEVAGSRVGAIRFGNPTLAFPASSHERLPASVCLQLLAPAAVSQPLLSGRWAATLVHVAGMPHTCIVSTHARARIHKRKSTHIRKRTHVRPMQKHVHYTGCSTSAGTRKRTRALAHAHAQAPARAPSHATALLQPGLPGAHAG